jgi:hypothetical protein
MMAGTVHQDLLIEVDCGQHFGRQWGYPMAVVMLVSAPRPAPGALRQCAGSHD